MKNGIIKRISIHILPLLASWLIRLWFGTCRIKAHGSENVTEAEKCGKPIIGTSWHYCVLGVFAFFTDRPLVLMISSSNDGDYLAKMADHLGFGVVRGSRNRKGVQATRELLKKMGGDKIAGLIADGSQGPARVAQPGPVLIASKTGGIVMPLLYSSNRYFRFNSWDRLILPKPFSRIDIFYGKPIHVPQGIKSAELETYRSVLEEKLNQLYVEAWQFQGKDAH